MAMRGHDEQGTPLHSRGALGQAGPAAWGRAAAQLQTPQSTLREAMLADEAQVPELPPHGRPVWPPCAFISHPSHANVL